MGIFFAIVIIIAMILYFIEMIMEPEKHKIGLVVLAIFMAFFGSLKDTSKKSRKRLNRW